MNKHSVWVFYSHRFAGGEFNDALRKLAGDNWGGEGSELFGREPVRDMSADFKKKSDANRYVKDVKKLASEHGVEVKIKQYVFNY